MDSAKQQANTAKQFVKEAADNTASAPLIDKATKPLMGQLPHPDHAMGHPLHPAFVHWPIAFLSTSLFAASLPLLSLRAPSSGTLLARLIPPAGTLPAIAHYTGIAGLLFTLPALVTGGAEGYHLLAAQVQTKGSWSRVLKEAWTGQDEAAHKAFLTIEHASANDVVAGVVGWNLYRSFTTAGFKLPYINSVASAVGLPLLMYSAMLGGKLVYEHGVGVQRQGTGKEWKEKSV